MQVVEVIFYTTAKIEDFLSQWFLLFRKFLVNYILITMVSNRSTRTSCIDKNFATSRICHYFDIHNLYVPNLQHKLKSSQREKVKKFISFTQTGENTAIYCLTQNDWKLDLASDNYFQNPDAYFKEPRNVDKRKLESLYSKYKDPNEPDKIMADGILRSAINCSESG